MQTNYLSERIKKVLEDLRGQNQNNSSELEEYKEQEEEQKMERKKIKEYLIEICDALGMDIEEGNKDDLEHICMMIMTEITDIKRALGG